MLEKDLFEYAVIRVVPRVEREEFINVGVILYCAKQNFLSAKIKLDDERLKAFCVEIDIEGLRNNLNALVQISNGSSESGPIGKLDAASRFRWLTATRSTVVQASKVHPGFCIQAKETLEKLYIELVL
ncbi:MAG: hypothetical protein K0R51_3064 [Cytophagaceae bacterium]|jgi:hypothetical protein|nr:hypothetical protein [Cytophagaceae bacterium]